MDYQLLSAPLDKVEYLFFTAGFKHRTTFYKVAVAEHVMAMQGFSGIYAVLLQSSSGTHSCSIHKSDDGIWLTDNPELSREILFLIGSQIDQIKE